MNKTPLQRCIDIAVTPTALAKRFGKKQQLVWSWLARSGQVSPDYVLRVSEAVGWKVAPHELRPDLYPHPDDGLPEHLRGKAAA